MGHRVSLILGLALAMSSSAHAGCIVKPEVFDKGLSLVLASRHCEAMNAMQDADAVQFLNAANALDPEQFESDSCLAEVVKNIAESEAMIKAGTAEQLAQMCQMAAATIHAAAPIEEMLKEHGILR